MKNKKIIISLFLLSLLLLNIYSLTNFFYVLKWNYYFWDKKYKQANDNYSKVDLFESKYNQISWDYKLLDYSWWLDLYSWILDCSFGEECVYLNHNIWNIYYRLWEKESDINTKKDNYEKSVSMYKHSLKINYDKETEKNLEFVLSKLNELKKQEEKKEEQETRDDNKKDDWGKIGTGQKDASSNDWQNNSLEQLNNSEQKDDSGKNNSSWEKASSWDKYGSSKNWKVNETWNDKAFEQWLSDEQKQAIEEYSNNLEYSQKDYWQYYNKLYQEQSDPTEVFNNFFWGDSFFDNSLLNNQKEEKDR